MTLILLHVIRDRSYDMVVACDHVMGVDIIYGFYQDSDGCIIMMHVQ